VAENNETIFLTNADVFCPQESRDAYFVQSGEVFVYIVPWSGEKLGRRVLLCEVEQKRMIPAFVYRDQNYAQWRFAIVAKDEAVLSVRKQSVTTVLHKKFLERANIGTYEQEGFERSLAEFYNREMLKDNAFITKGERAEPKAKSATYESIHNAFKDSVVSSDCANTTYQALRFLCEKLEISIVAENELLARCGKDPGVEAIARASHFICRNVVLEAAWYRSDCGGLICTLDGQMVACIRAKDGKYQVYHASSGRIETMTAQIAQKIAPQAYAIGRTLPSSKLTKKDIIRFCKKSITPYDLLPLAVLSLVGVLIGVLLPMRNQTIYDQYIPLGDAQSLGQLCALILSFMFGNLCFGVVKNLFAFRITSRAGNDLQNAAYHRLFHLPESFFRNYDSADLGQRVMMIGGTANRIVSAVLTTGLSAVFSVIYLIQMCSYSGDLAWIGVGMYLVYAVFAACATLVSKKKEIVIAEHEAQAGSKLYQYINGVDKIRMAGVEDRALLSYMQPYTQAKREEIKLNRFLSAVDMVSCVRSTLFSMVFYFIIVSSGLNLSVGAFIAFTGAFGSFTGAMSGLVDEILELYQEKDVMKRFWPIFEAVPEDDESKEVPGALLGRLSLEHVNFSYSQGGKNVLDDLSLHINPGEYVGIVGSSGCGKSTLLKLLLGFEMPQSGMVMVDGKDLNNISKNAYRRQLGVVLQNGKLLSGSIYENITITAPNTSMKRVEEVIEQVGLKRDIEQMPMGIHTMLSENCNTISGGQMQRILIARAIVGEPAILIFDEATSALDNMTQAAVSSSLDKMKVTRIVVAHRLSTIKNCDRILVLKDGRVAEEGSYDSLMARRGMFYALASRQIVE
jgi:ATP-binding cassette subfamily C protein